MRRRALELRSSRPIPAIYSNRTSSSVTDRLYAIVAPTYSFASSLPAVAGYPNLSIPVGLTPEGKPPGLWMYSGFLREPILLALAYDLQQAIKTTDATAISRVRCICATLTAAAAPKLVDGRAKISHHIGLETVHSMTAQRIARK
jgi:hypothetical protein